MVPSSSMKHPSVTLALAEVEKTEALMNVILYLTHPSQYTACRAVRSKMLGSTQDTRVHTHLKKWPSLFTGCSWITNRLTPAHRDGSGFYQGFDYLSVSGRASSWLKLRDLGLNLPYGRGCVVGLAGRILTHQVGAWGCHDRICTARWIRKEVFEDLGVHSISFPTVEQVGKRLRS